MRHFTLSLSLICAIGPWAPRAAAQAPAVDEASRVEALIQSPLEGEILRDPKGELFFVPARSPELRLKLSNSADFSPAVVGIPVVASLRANPDGWKAERVQLESVHSLAGGGLPLDMAHKARVRTAVAELEVASAQAFSRGAMTPEQADAQLRTKLQNAEDEIAAAFVAATRAEQRQLIAPLRAVKKAQKALYIRRDIYRPEAYRRIYENSRGAVGLARKNTSEPYCSGALIAANMVLTAAHCLEGIAAADQEIEARFNFELDLAGNSLAVDTYPISRVVVTSGGRAYDPDGPEIDFALLELGKSAGGAVAGDVWPVQCLSSVRVLRDEPLYVIGHPEGRPRAVHDNAFVYFPFRATDRELKNLRALVEAEVLDDPDAQKHLAEFTGSYRHNTEGGGSVWENYSLRWDKQPTIAADCDTFHGNSGSAVFSRNDHAIVGILFAGEEDVDAPWTPGWRAHEAILPITEVMKRLDLSAAGWRAWPKVCLR